MRAFGLLTVLAVVVTLSAKVSLAQQSSDPTVVPPEGPLMPTYIAGSFIEIFEDADPWNNPRVQSVLDELGFIAGVDYGVNPTTDLITGIPVDAQVVIIPSNPYGVGNGYNNVNDPVVQATLANFVQNGGVLVMHLADIKATDGYLAPSLALTPFSIQVPPLDLVAPGSHPFVVGPDALAGTADDATQANIQSVLITSGFGYLGTLPVGATTLISNAGNPVMAEYPLGNGRVIVTTTLMEFRNNGEVAGGIGMPRRVLTNELHFAIFGASCAAPVATASLTLVASGDDEGTNGDDDEGQFVVEYGIGNPVEACEPAVCTGELVCGAQRVAVQPGEIVEIEIDDEGCEIEWEDGFLEIEGPDVVLEVTCTNSAGSETVIALPLGLAPDNDDEQAPDD